MRLALLLLLTNVASADPRRDIETAVASSKTKLKKLDLRPTMKQVFPTVTGCYQRELAKQPRIEGVVNTQLLIRNEPKIGMTLTVEGFETDGPLGNQKTFLDCVKTTFEGKVFPAIAMRGTAHVTYPGTFTTQPVDNHDLSLVESATKHLEAKRWARALADASKGLKLLFLDGVPRRKLIEIAGVAACELKDEQAARRYWGLASPEYEERIAKACSWLEL